MEDFTFLVLGTVLAGAFIMFGLIGAGGSIKQGELGAACMVMKMTPVECDTYRLQLYKLGD